MNDSVLEVRLLLIEDDPDLSQLLVRYLTKTGFEVTHFADGQSGIDTFAAAAKASTPFDVVLSDGLLPRKTGFQVAQAIRATPSGRNVGLALFSAAFRGGRAKTDALAAGFDAYFAKPFVLADLKEGLEKLARRGKPTSQPPMDASTPPSPPPSPPTGSRRPSGLTLIPLQVLSGLPSTARYLMQAARARLDGLIEIKAEAGTTRVAFMGGVIVGAMDDAPEHALGPWLQAQGRLSSAQVAALDARLRGTGERVAEALLGLGFLTGREALYVMEQQARSRVKRALGLYGDARVVVDDRVVNSLAAGAIDLVDVVMQVGLDPAQRLPAKALTDRLKASLIHRTVDFDRRLVALSRLRPQSTLPMRLMAGGLRFSDLSEEESLEVYAMWLAGLVRGDDEAAVAVALPVGIDGVSRDAVVDVELADAIAGLVLKVRGGNVYRLLGMPPSASSAQVVEALHELNGRYGKAALHNASLGPAQAAARELQAAIEEGIFVFSDERRRRSYDDDVMEPILML